MLSQFIAEISCWGNRNDGRLIYPAGQKRKEYISTVSGLNLDCHSVLDTTLSPDGAQKAVDQ
jgi:hypothetical protein